MPQKVRYYLGYFFIEKKDISKCCFIKKIEHIEFIIILFQSKRKLTQFFKLFKDSLSKISHSKLKVFE